MWLSIIQWFISSCGSVLIRDATICFIHRPYVNLESTGWSKSSMAEQATEFPWCDSDVKWLFWLLYLLQTSCTDHYSMNHLTLTTQNCSRRQSNCFLFYFSEKISLVFQQSLFSLKNDKKNFLECRLPQLWLALKGLMQRHMGHIVTRRDF